MCKRGLCLFLVIACMGVAWGEELAPDDSSLNENLCLWLRMPEVNYDPVTEVWTDLSAKVNDARADVPSHVGPTLSSGENATVFAHSFGAVHFDPATQDLLKATDLNGGDGLTDLTIFSVVRVVDAGSTDQRAVGFGSYNDGGLADHFDMSFDVTVRKDNGSVSGKNQDLPLGEFIIWAARMDAQSINMWFNSTGAISLAFTATGKSYTTGTDQFYVGDVRYPAVGDFDVAEVVVFNTALTDEQVEGVCQWLQAYVGVKAQEMASRPSPADGAVDVPRDLVLDWMPVETAATRDVYFGAIFDDVNDADIANPMDVLVGQDMDVVAYDVGRLEFGQTYYWRIDEANGAPDNTIFTGDVWSFTTELLAYPISNVIATTTGVSDDGAGPENIVNGSGLDADGQHSVESSDMWVAVPVEGEPLALQFEFDGLYKLHQMLIWNYNVAFEILLGFGAKEATIEYSADGIDWTVLGEIELAQATAVDTYTANTTIDFGGVAVKYVKLTINGAYGTTGKVGLSEVRFLSIPVQSREPQPADGAVDVTVADATLNWRAGREAASHEVSLGIDPNALALIDTVSDTTIDPGALALATTYYWKVDEVNTAEAIGAWEGAIWSFSTEEFILVEDFESYTDDIDAGEAIFLTWVDGYEVEGNNSQVGYIDAPFAEETIVHGGGQSMPLHYDNVGGGTSEATRTFAVPQDWTQHGIKGLTLWFYGAPANTAVQMYVKIDNTKVAYDGDAENLLRTPWQMWYIDLTGLNVSSVTELTIGLEGAGTGLVFIDDIMLTSYDRQLVTPTEPDTANLVSHFAFDGDANDSTGAHSGTAIGSPSFVAGKVGQAINLTGVGEYVELTGYQGILGASAVTATAWINTTNTETGAILGWGPNVGGQRFGFRIDAGRLRFEHHSGNIQGDTAVNDGAWHHAAVTIEADATISYPQVTLWLDGVDDTRPATDPDAFDLTADLDVRIGSRAASDDRFFMGQIDELYLYDRALSQGEIAYMAGRTQPFDIE